MVHVVWEFRIRPEKRLAFETHYSSEGSWVVLFRRSQDFLGTSLVQDADDSNRYLTIDRWTTLRAYDTFREITKEEYAILDSACEELTVEEHLVGRFEDR